MSSYLDVVLFACLSLPEWDVEEWRIRINLLYDKQKLISKNANNYCLPDLAQAIIILQTWQMTTKEDYEHF